MGMSRRSDRNSRGSTRNESCGEGGNDSAEKPRLRSKEDTVPVRKPKKSVKNAKPKESRDPKPKKIREPKPRAFSMDDPVKQLFQFNDIINDLSREGFSSVEKAGGFSTIEDLQFRLKEQLQILGQEDLPLELKDVFSRLTELARSNKHVWKERREDGRVVYHY